MELINSSCFLFQSAFGFTSNTTFVNAFNHLIPWYLLCTITHRVLLFDGWTGSDFVLYLRGYMI